MRFRAHTLLHSFAYALAGIYFMLRTQRNIRIHLSAGFLAYCLGIWLGLSLRDFADITIVVGMVVVAEMFNTAVENAVDLATHRRHPLAKAAKDVAAAAVLIASTVAVVVGVLLLGPRLCARIW